MGDVAAILGIARPSAGAGGIDFADTGAFKRRVSASLANDDAAPVKAKKSKISREVSALLGSQPSEVIAPLIPVRKIAIGGFKEKAGSKSSKNWAWKPFTSSARRDGLQLQHWVRADAEYTDYPFARFKSRTDIIKYTDSEYQDMLEQDRKNMKREQYEQIQDQWPKDQTDHLFDLARRFELRWPLILDRWEKKPTKSIEELKRRFFTVTSRILRSRRLALPAPIDENASDPRRVVDPRETFEYKFDADKLRRKQLENAFGMLNESTQEERRLLKELASVETQIRKIEKKLQSGGVALSFPAGGAAHAHGAAGTEAEHYPGSELMAARNLAAKSHAPVLLPSDAASASVSALMPPRKLVAGSVAARTAASSASQHSLMTPEANPFTLPVALRTMQMAVAPDALPADSRAVLKTSMTAAALHVPDKPLPSLRVMTAMNQLRRETVNLSILSREVDLLEADVYRLEHVRKSAGLNNFNGNAKPTFDSKDVAHKIKAGELRPDAAGKQAEASARLVSSLAVQHPSGVRAGSALLVHAATGGPGVPTLVTLSAALPKEAKAAAQAILDKRAANGKERVREKDEAAARAAAAEAAALATPAGPPESTSHVVVKQEGVQASPVVHAHPAPTAPQPRLTPATSVGGGMAGMGVPSASAPATTSAGSGMPPGSVPSSAPTSSLLASATASPQGGVKGQIPPAAVGTPTGAVKGSSVGGLPGVPSLPSVGVPSGAPLVAVPAVGAPTPGTASAAAGGMKQAGLPTVPSAQSLTGAPPSSFFSAPMSNIQSTFYPLPGVSAASNSLPFLPPLPTLSTSIESLRQPAAGTGTPASAAPPASMGLPRIGSAQALSTPSISVPAAVSATAAAGGAGGGGPGAGGGGAGTPAGSTDSGPRQTRNKRGREASEGPAVKKGKTE